MSKTTSTTGIGVRDGTVELGGLSSQAVPFVLPSAAPVAASINPIAATIASPAIADSLRAGNSPLLAVPASAVLSPVSATPSIAQRMSSYADIVPSAIPNAMNRLQFRPTASPASLQIINTNFAAFRRPNEETLSLARLSFKNTQFEQADPHGINVLRPEIISLMDFEPVYAGTTLVLNSSGLLLDVQYQARQLREQTFLQLVDSIRQSDRSNQLANIQNNFAQSFNRINSAADFYQNTIITLETMKKGFDIKAIQSNEFDLRNFRTLKDYYESFMLFPHDVMSQFSNTKIVMQLLFDLRMISENYSMNLLNLSDPDRQAGGAAVTSPVSIDRSYNTRNGYSFTFDTIRSFGAADNATSDVFFQRFGAALPGTPDDRIKVILTMLSKEIRVSRGLGRPAVQRKLREKFGATTTDGSPFDNIIGGVGNSIFEPVIGNNSLANLLVVNDSANSAVLPFETKYIDVNNTRKVYVPGSSFFIDTIINTESSAGFNTAPLRQYVERYIDTVDSATDIIANVFDYSDRPSNLSPGSMLKSMLQGIVRGLGFLGTTQQLSAAEAGVAAAFRLANTDPDLKLMLFQYMILRLLARQGTDRFFANAIITDLDNDIRNLSFVVVNERDSLPDLHEPNSLRPFMDRLGTTIQNRIATLIDQNDTLASRLLAQTRSRTQTRSDGRAIVGFDVDITYGIPSALNQSSILDGLVLFVAGLEGTIGNEINGMLDSARRTRYNALSVSSLALLSFEAYLNLINRFVSSDFQISQFTSNFPDMSVDRAFNDRMARSMQAIISNPEKPLPIIEPVAKTTSTTKGVTVQQSGDRFNTSQQASATAHVHDQAAQAATTTTNSNTASDITSGILQNASVLTGPYATAGDRFTETADLVLRQINSHVNVNDLIDAQAIDQSLNSISLKLFQDDFAVACGIHILAVIKRRLRNALDVALNYFTDATLLNFTKLNATSIQDIGRNLTPTQVRLLIRQRDEYNQELSNGPQGGVQFIPVSQADGEVRNALMSLLAKGAFRETNDASERYRLLTVGIPAGFSKNLADRINGSNLTNDSFRRNKANDVIYINVYKRSLEFPEIIFKPQKFIFDMALFPNGYKNLGIQATDNFDSVLQRVTLLDYDSFKQPITVTVESIVNNDKYYFLANTQVKRAMVENHVLSDLFSQYIRFLTTMKLDEDTFVNTASMTYQNLSLGAGSDLTPQFAELVRRYLIAKRTQDIRTNPSLSPLPDVPIEDMLQSQTVDQSTKDTLQLLKFGNVAFKVENALAQLLSPKLFDRIFTIPLNIDGFDIDYARTTATQTGRDFFQKDFVQRRLDPRAPAGTYRFKPRTIRDTVFEDYFVTIELVE